MQICPNLRCKADNSDDARFCRACGTALLGLLGRGVMLQNRYQIKDLLGCGGYGAVYLATDTHFNVPVAIKENHQPTATQQFITEAKLLATLSHPNLPRVRDYFVEATGRQYIVMDFIDGKTLHEVVLAKRCLSEREALNLLKGVFDAVIYLHSQNPPVIHRDIKPQNIIVTAEGKAVLVDLGIAKVGGASVTTSTGARGVTPGFAPIEQYGVGRTDERSDIYALGATLYFCLTGHVPPPAPDLAAGTARLFPVRYLNRAVSVTVANAIEKAMAIQQPLRFASVKEFWQELNNITTAPKPKPIQASNTSSISPVPQILSTSSRDKNESLSASPFPTMPRDRDLFSPPNKIEYIGSAAVSAFGGAILGVMAGAIKGGVGGAIWGIILGVILGAIFGLIAVAIRDAIRGAFKGAIGGAIAGAIVGAIGGAIVACFAWMMNDKDILLGVFLFFVIVSACLGAMLGAEEG